MYTHFGLKFFEVILKLDSYLPFVTSFTLQCTQHFLYLVEIRYTVILTRNLIVKRGIFKELKYDAILLNACLMKRG